MPYRRLPNTDAARLRAMSIAKQRYEEAEGYLQKAWDMTKDDGEKTSYNVAVSLARAKALRGDKPSARTLLRIASRHVDRLGSDYRKLYDRLSSELK